ncbi:MAG: hypothetical protein Q8K72_17070, partial [Acidimicrobiales bacterium]|nr:hypothetical protein [Acidimicrobiales bacterium]
RRRPGGVLQPDGVLAGRRLDGGARADELTALPAGLAIEALFDQIGTKTTATATGVYVSDISGDEARALVVVDVVASSAETPDQRLVDLTFLLDLVIEDGEWKVEAVNPAPRPDVVGGPTTTSPATPPTTAPTTTVPGG